MGIFVSSIHLTRPEIIKGIIFIRLLSELTARCYQVNIIYQITPFKPISPPLTCNQVNLFFDGLNGFVSMKQHKNSQKE